MIFWRQASVNVRDDIRLKFGCFEHSRSYRLLFVHYCAQNPPKRKITPYREARSWTAIRLRNPWACISAARGLGDFRNCGVQSSGNAGRATGKNNKNGTLCENVEFVVDGAAAHDDNNNIRCILTLFRIFALSRGLKSAMTALNMAGGFIMCIWATRSG